MTNQPHWFKVAKKLYSNNIAKPILWLGDDIHYDKAKLEFGDDAVVKMQDFVHRPYKFKEINYSGNDSDFLVSENYIRAKDKCLKMMDRLDLNSSFNRLDKEVYFHNIILWALNKFNNNKPDVLIVVENPHSHAQYIIYEICKFYEIPIFKFNSWMPAPLVFLKKDDSEYIIPKPKKYINSKYDLLINNDINKFIDDIIYKRENFEMFYMKIQKKNRIISSRIKSYITDGWKNDFNDIKHNSYMLINSLYNPINPYRFNFFIRKYIRLKRVTNLRKNEKKAISHISIDKQFVYFPLHFEPERTTNPDGGIFHDQFIALIKLRDFVPKNIDIIVKEHPSQFFMADKGSKGRSPLFYNLIKNIRGVKLIDSNYNSIELIIKSNFLATISGSVALEGALLGKKAIIFGDTWFNNCPNIFSWNNGINYSSFIDKELLNHHHIKVFLQNLMKGYSIPSFQNLTKRTYFKKFNNMEFDYNQTKNLYYLLEDFFLGKLFLK